MAGVLSKEQAKRRVRRDPRDAGADLAPPAAHDREAELKTLADTSFLIDLMQGDEKAKTRSEALVGDSVPVMVGTPTIFELYVGVGLAIKSPEEREKVLELLRSLTQLPLDAPSARRAGEIYAQKVRDGSPIEAEDAMIAGIALENQQALLTRNVKHFARDSWA